MLNIVVPMAGRGSRFAKEGYVLPKPLVDIHGKPMIEYVTKNITPKCEHRIVYLCLQEHLEEYDLKKKLEEISDGCVVIPVNRVTEGAACTVLLAEQYINNDDMLMLANSDQYVDIDINEYLDAIRENDGLIMTMCANDPKWSFIQFNSENLVTMVREKEVISNEATVGIYNFRKGSDFIKYAYRMINKNIRVNGEFYVAPIYNEMIEDGKKVGFYNVGSENHGMYGLGTPSDLEQFLKNPISNSVL